MTKSPTESAPALARAGREREREARVVRLLEHAVVVARGEHRERGVQLLGRELPVAVDVEVGEARDARLAERAAAQLAHGARRQRLEHAAQAELAGRPARALDQPVDRRRRERHRQLVRLEQRLEVARDEREPARASTSARDRADAAPRAPAPTPASAAATRS